MLTRLWLIALREVKAYFADRGDLAFSLLLPVVILALLIGAFGSGTTFHGTAYVVDNDGGPAAQTFLTQLKGVKGLHVTLLSASDARKRIDHSSILLYTEIPAGFSNDFATGNPVSVVEYQRGNGAQADQIVSGFIAQVAQRMGAETLLRKQVADVLQTAGVAVPDQQIAPAVSGSLAAAQSTSAVAVVTEDTKKPIKYDELMFPGIVVMFSLFAISLNAQSLVQQRRGGTFERLLTTRLTVGEFLTGLFLGNIFRGLIQLTVLFALAAVTLRFFTLSSFIWGLLFGLMVVVAASAFSLGIAVIVRTQEQAIWIPVFATMIMTVFGGTFFAVTSGTTLGTLARGTFTYWANTGLQRIVSDGATLAGVLGPLAVLSGITVAGFVASHLIFARILRRATI